MAQKGGFAQVIYARIQPNEGLKLAENMRRNKTRRLPVPNGILLI